MHEFNDEIEETDPWDHWPELATTTIGQIDAAVRGITPAAAADTVLLWIDRTCSLICRAKEIRAEMESRAVEWIATHGDLVLGDIRYTTGERTTTKCIHVRLGVESLLTATGGEPSRLAEYLKSDPFKYGSCRSILTPTQFDRIFQTECKTIFKSGRPVRQLRRLNDRFRS